MTLRFHIYETPFTHDKRFGFEWSSKIYSGWSLGAAVTDKGECGNIEAYDVMQQDASDLLELTMWWANASHADDTARIKTLAQLKLLCRGQYILDPDLINDLKVKI